MVTRDRARAVLASLRPASVFLESYDSSQRLPLNLDIYFGPPEEFFIAPETQQPFTKGVLVPILDDGQFACVTFLDPRDGSLQQFYVEQPEVSVAQFDSWQQYLAALLFRIAEGIDDDGRLLAIAELIGFGSTSAFMRCLEPSHSGETYDQLRRRQTHFIASLLDPH